MRKKMIVLMGAMLATACMVGFAFAAAGKVVSVQGEKVTVSAKGHGLAVGAAGVEVKGPGGTIKGKVAEVDGDKVTIQVRKGKASSLKAGEAVSIDQKKKAGSEEMQGC
ncbi:MAG TPA: hypothetical protein VGK27_07175 [Candidatus Deferrimicrobiaceae bacterium]|jgi:vacuolar-type H+-ATPase catalytic subunit A/Vma1